MYLQNSVSAMFSKKSITDVGKCINFFSLHLFLVFHIPVSFASLFYQPFAEKMLVVKTARILTWMLFIRQC